MRDPYSKYSSPLYPGKPDHANSMKSREFKFRQFAVSQAEAGMKVCTDATLFGAMAPVRAGERVCDIGTGTGLLALMVAQLGAGRVTAVELIAEVAREAADNVRASPWADRIEVVQADIKAHAAERHDRFDLVISNPPFFQRHSASDDRMRHVARHADQLSYSELLDAATSLMAETGRFYVLLPGHAADDFSDLAARAGLHLAQRTDIRGYQRNRPNVAALQYAFTAAEPCRELLTIYQADREYSTQAARWLRPFLLRFAD